ncbi:MAG: hypothetical protein HY731_11870 [Candidatus Tectomicrobia bacterium]|nr:hypothetical protein [Candidatus Tectomicrobia bacterium]
MPLPGGSADKLGNRYEGRWTVVCMVEVMDERADAIRLEPPGVEGEGVEFWLQRENVREYYQAKRQHSASGRWTLAELNSKGVLSHFLKKLNDETAWYIFVSTDSAFQLRELSERARKAPSWEEFQREFLKADQQSSAFDNLCYYWGDCSQPDAYEALKRIRVETLSEDLLRTLLKTAA